MSDESNTGDGKDEGWEYIESGGSSVTMDDVDNDDLEEPRTAVSKYVPLIKYDSEKNTFSVTTRLR